MKEKLLVMLLLALTFTGCKSKKENNTEDTTENQGIVVKTMIVRKSETASMYRYSGTVEAFKTIPLSFQSTGTVKSVLVDAGDVVKKGQLLATTDRANAQSMYEMSLAKFQQAQDAYNRLKTVHDKGSLPEIKWVEMQTNLESAKSSLAMSKDNLDKCNLYAPSDGVVGKRSIEPGMSAISITGSPIELVEINNVYIKLSVPENEIGKIKKGQKSTITVSALGNKSFSGEVSKISPVADAISRTYEVKILINNQSLELKPGMVCDVVMPSADGDVCMLIPYQAATKNSNDQAFVYVVNTATRIATKQLVTLGNYNGSNIEVVSGLKEGQTIVTEGKDKLSDNVQVEF